jgi:hypothetical protein
MSKKAFSFSTEGADRPEGLPHLFQSAEFLLFVNSNSNARCITTSAQTIPVGYRKTINLVHEMNVYVSWWQGFMVGWVAACVICGGVMLLHHWEVI